MKYVLLFTLMTLATALKAEVGKEHVESMLEQMVRDNVISAEEAKKAKIRMQSMNNQQWAAINEQAQAVAARGPASTTPSENRIEEVKGIDLDGAQFKQIQDDIKKIVPEYRD